MNPTRNDRPSIEELKAIPIAEVIAGSGLTVERCGHWLTTVEHDSIRIFPRTNSYFWYQAGHGGTAIDWIINTQRVDFTRACEILSQHRGQALHVYQPPPVAPPPPPLDPELPTRCHQALTGDDIAWWERRHIFYPALLHFQLGVLADNYYGTCYTIPVYEDGVLANLRLRLATPKRPQDKYRPYDVGRGTQLYNADCLTPDVKGVVIVAGELKCCVLWQYGIPAVSPTAGCGHWRPEWTARLQYCERVYVCYDPGETAGALHVMREIGDRARLVELDQKPDDYVACVGPGALRAALKRARRIADLPPTLIEMPVELARTLYAAPEPVTPCTTDAVPWRAQLWQNTVSGQSG